MKRSRYPSSQTKAVLFELAKDPAIWRYGYELCRETNLKAGTLYPILMRLADRKFLETMWESEIPQGRPPRHMYRLTNSGMVLSAELEEIPILAAKTKGIRLKPRLEEA